IEIACFTRNSIVTNGVTDQSLLVSRKSEQRQRRAELTPMSGAMELVQLGNRFRCIQIVAERIEHVARDAASSSLSLKIAIPLPQRLMRFVEPNFGPIERLTVLGAKHVEADRLARPGIALPALQQLVHRDEIACALRHLLPFDLKEAVMHPDLRHEGRVIRAA